MSGPRRAHPAPPHDRRPADLARTSRTRRNRRAANPAAGRLETLEERVLLSTTYPLDTTRWTPLGPAPIVNGQTSGGGPVSGRIAGLAGDPTNPNIDYIAAAGGGVWKTTDAGASWTPLTDNQSTLFMGAIAVAPSNGQVIYAGTGEANNSLDSFYGRGVLVSQNGGSTWTLTTAGGAFDRETMARIAVDPTNPAVAYAAVADFGSNGLFNGNAGIWKTTNFGASWTDTTKAAGLDTYSPYSDVVLNAANPQILYAAIGRYDGVSTNGVIESTNGGTSWTYLSNGIPQGSVDGNIKLAISPTNPNVLYASIANGTQSGTFGALRGLYETTNGGTSWVQQTNTPNYLGNQGWYDNTIAVDPANPSIVYAAGQLNYSNNTDAIVESQDGGSSWFDLTTGADGNGPHTDHHALAFDASGRLLDGNDGGIWRLANKNNGSVLWNDLNTNLQTIQFTGIATDPSNANVAYGGSQDNGTEKFTGSTQWNLIAYGDGGFTRVDPSNPATVYQEYTGVSLYRSDNGGQSFVEADNGIPHSEASEFYLPYILDPANPARVLAGATNVYESTNKGGSFRKIGGPGVTGWDATGTISYLATFGNTVYATVDIKGTNAPKILVTTNDGTSWTDVTPAGGNAYKGITLDPANPQVAYAVSNQITGGVNHVLRTTNGGASWTDISGNLPDLPVNAVTLGTVGGVQTLFIGNDSGVYSAPNPTASVTWSRLGTNFPNAQVVSLDFDPTAGLLAAGTHGRGLFELSVQGIAQTGNGAAVATTTFGYRDYGAGWTNTAGAAAGTTARAHAAGTGAEYATWTLSRPAGGTYQLFTTWVADPSNATNAAYKVYNGGTLLATVTANQQATPGTLSVNGVPYFSLGTYTFSTGVPRVILTDAANGRVVADRVYAAYPDPAFTGTPSGANGPALPPPGTVFADNGVLDPAPVTPPGSAAAAAVIATVIGPADGAGVGPLPLGPINDGTPPGRRKPFPW